MTENMEDIGKERIDFDIDRIAENNPFELVVSETTADDSYRRLLLAEKGDRRFGLYNNWLGKRVEDVLFNGCTPDTDRIAGSFGAGTATKLYRVEGTYVVVDYSANADRHFFVVVERKGNYQVVVGKITDLKKQVEQGIFDYAID